MAFRAGTRCAADKVRYEKELKELKVHLVHEAKTANEKKVQLEQEVRSDHPAVCYASCVPGCAVSL